MYHLNFVDVEIIIYVLYNLLQGLHTIHQFRDGQHVSQTVENTVRSKCCVDVRALSHIETGLHVLAHAATSVLKVSILRVVSCNCSILKFETILNCFCVNNDYKLESFFSILFYVNYCLNEITFFNKINLVASFLKLAILIRIFILIK